jgi:hypothetical protein
MVGVCGTGREAHPMAVRKQREREREREREGEEGPLSQCSFKAMLQ